VWDALRGVNRWIRGLPPAASALVVALAVFVLLTAVFAIGASSLASALAQAAVWAILAGVAVLGGSAMRAQRNRRGR